jgi:magnesium transporter
MEATRSSPPSRSDAASAPAPAVRIVAVDRAGTAVPVDGLDGLAAALRDPDLRLWIDLADPDPPALERIAGLLGLHDLVVEDIREQNQRAKVERLDGTLHLVLFAISYQGEVVETEVDFVLAPRYVLTAHDAELDLRRAPQMRAGPEPLLASGPDYLLYAILDWLVDDYFPGLDRLTDEIDDLQDRVIEGRSPWTLQRLFVLKRELIALRRATTPAREILNQLTNRELGMIAAEHVVYYRDVYDHLIRVTDELDTYRELVAGTVDIYLTSVNNELSNIMKRLTGVTVILAGIGAVAGIFGMSEAGVALAGGESSGFWMVAGATVVGAVLVAVLLRRIDWI